MYCEVNIENGLTPVSPKKLTVAIVFTSSVRGCVLCVGVCCFTVPLTLPYKWTFCLLTILNIQIQIQIQLFFGWNGSRSGFQQRFQQRYNNINYDPSYQPSWPTLTRAPLGSGDQRAPLGGHFGPPDISRTTQRSDKRQTALDSPGGELFKAYTFFENRGHGSGQTEVKCQILLFLTMATTETK